MPSRTVRLATTAACIAGLAGLSGCMTDKGGPGAPGAASWKKTDQAALAAARPEAEPKIPSKTHYAAGRLLEQRGDFEAAIRQYRRAVALNHRDVEALNRLGATLDRMGRFAEADEALAGAICIEPGQAYLRNNLAFNYMLQRRWSDAEAELRNALLLDPEFARARVNLALVLAQQQRFDDALAEFCLALPEADAHYNMGLIHRAQGRYADAVDSFKKALAIDPSLVAAAEQLANMQAKRQAPSSEPPFERSPDVENEPTADGLPSVEEESLAVESPPASLDQPAVPHEQTADDVVIGNATEPEPPVAGDDDAELEPCDEGDTFGESIAGVDGGADGTTSSVSAADAPSWPPDSEPGQAEPEWSTDDDATAGDQASEPAITAVEPAFPEAHGPQGQAASSEADPLAERHGCRPSELLDLMMPLDDASDPRPSLYGEWEQEDDLDLRSTPEDRSAAVGAFWSAALAFRVADMASDYGPLLTTALATRLSSAAEALREALPPASADANAEGTGRPTPGGSAQPELTETSNPAPPPRASDARADAPLTNAREPLALPLALADVPKPPFYREWTDFDCFQTETATPARESTGLNLRLPAPLDQPGWRREAMDLGWHSAGILRTPIGEHGTGWRSMSATPTQAARQADEPGEAVPATADVAWPLWTPLDAAAVLSSETPVVAPPPLEWPLEVLDRAAPLDMAALSRPRYVDELAPPHESSPSRVVDVQTVAADRVP